MNNGKYFFFIYFDVEWEEDLKKNAFNSENGKWHLDRDVSEHSNAFLMGVTWERVIGRNLTINTIF